MHRGVCIREFDKNDGAVYRRASFNSSFYYWSRLHLTYHSLVVSCISNATNNTLALQKCASGWNSPKWVRFIFYGIMVFVLVMLILFM